jgi:hypothetical protein
MWLAGDDHLRLQLALADASSPARCEHEGNLGCEDGRSGRAPSRPSPFLSSGGWSLPQLRLRPLRDVVRRPCGVDDTPSFQVGRVK